MIHWKFIAGCAAVAAVLSFAAGLFGRVAFGPLLMRAILSGIVFGGIATGFELLTRKFLPELFSGSEDVDNNRESEEATTGGGVDIIVDEEEPVSFAPQVDFEEAEMHEDADAFIEADRDAGNAEEPEGEAPPEEKQDVESPQEPTAKESSGNGLPSIEDFSGTFEGVSGGAAGVDSLDSSKARTLEAVDSLGGENDPATMAKAIRSMVQKDQEG